MHVPESLVGTRTIAARLGIDEQWIVSRTGVRERHIAGPEERLSNLAAVAARKALLRAELSVEEIDLVLVATITQDEFIPNAAPLVVAELGMVRAGAIDVGAGCNGFISAVSLAAGYVEAGRAEHVLVIGADLITRYVDFDCRRTAGLFGDGAGAVTVSAGDTGFAAGLATLRVDPSGPPLIYATRAEGLMRMEGPETFKCAVERISEVTLTALETAEVALDDVDLFVYHQANTRIVQAVGRRLELHPERVVDCIDKFGNTSAASIPIALSVADEEGRLHEGDTILMGAFGAGFVYGALVLRWGSGDRE
jgi:3-oxoacyl-[acyl-carrier-protein] synthase-3